MSIFYTNGKRMLEYGSMNAYSDIYCFSTTRHGGYSSGEYDSFNCNEFCGDEAESVRKNREMLCGLLPGKDAKLIIPHQIHRTEVRIIDEDFMQLTEEDKATSLDGVDALVTMLRNVCICVSTADCVPVLCCDKRLGIVSAIHAGWRGTAMRIVECTLKAMSERFGTRGEDVMACIGPSISKDAFEVGDEVYACFERAGFNMGKIASRMNKWHIDLWEANRIQLLDFGVRAQQIEVSGICTWQDNDDFFSARRQGIASGRILSGIMLKNSE